MVEPQQTNIQIAFPEAGELRLNVAAGACRLKITPGSGPDWVTGTYVDPTGSLPLNITQEGGALRIDQIRNWPEAWGAANQPPRLELALGAGRPYQLTLEGGASEGIIELGGLPLTRLALKYGAGSQKLSFSAPNPQSMALLSVQAGAAEIRLDQLGNANFAEFNLEGGAAGYFLDFGGTLRQEARVRIRAGVSGIDLRVPATTAARIFVETVLGGVDVGDGFMKREGSFWNDAALKGATPTLNVQATVAMGGIKLRQG